MKLLAIFVIAFALANANVIQHPNPEETPGLFEGDIAGITWDSAKGAYQIPSLARGLWPSGVVPYVLDTSAGYSQTEKKAILAGMQLLEDSTRQNGRNCITFVPRTTESTYIRVIRGNGCYSYAGKQIMSGAQDLSIGTGCADPIIVAHEFIHALGWFHEQSRPDRDLYVTVYYDNIQKGMEGNFQKMTTSQVGQMDIPYDYDSVMHYPETAFSTNGKKTMVPKKVGANIGQRSFVSPLDIREIRDAYKCT